VRSDLGNGEKPFHRDREIGYQIIRERRDLFHTADRNIFDPFRLALLKERVINLT
jgi:hypothetical protein